MSNKNKQKWLTSKIRGEYREIDEVMEIAVFQCLVHYMERDGGLAHHTYDLDKDVEMGHIIEEDVEDIKKTGEKLIHCYEYIKNELPILEEKMMKTMDWRELEEMDKQFHDKNTEIMKIIVENRGVLWV